MKETYKKEITSLGSSDIAALTITGIKDGKLTAEILDYYIDANYKAYIVTDKGVEIPDYYDLISTWDTWIRIYDDETLVFHFHKYNSKIEIYRAGDCGTIIRILE